MGDGRQAPGLEGQPRCMKAFFCRMEFVFASKSCVFDARILVSIFEVLFVVADMHSFWAMQRLESCQGTSRFSMLGY